MTINNFIPTVWASALLENLNDSHVYAKCVNRDYEGDIRDFGDTVKINTIGRVTISTYTKNSNLGSPETLQDSDLFMTIDTGKTFHFAIDDLDKAQQKPKIMGEAMKEASWGISDTIDVYLATLITGTIDSANQMTARTIGTVAGAEDAYELLVDMGVLLDDTNTPSGNRWAVVPNWFHGMLLKDDRFVGFGTGPNLSRLRGDPIGEAGGFTIYKSNNVPASGSAKTIVAGYKGAVAFAEQVVKVEAYRPELRFADAVKGLHVYGGKTLRPSNLVTCNVTQA